MTATTTNTVWIQDESTAPFAVKAVLNADVFIVFANNRQARFCRIWNSSNLEILARPDGDVNYILAVAAALQLAATIASNMDEWRARAQGVTNG